MASRIFAIPDIHGRLDLLLTLLGILREVKKLDLESGDDKLIFLGDYVDRGTDSYGVLKEIRHLATEYPKTVVALAGNHEWLMIDGCTKDQDRFYLWLANGGGRTLESFPEGRVPEDVLRWVAALPLLHEEPGFFFSHAPVPREQQRKIAMRGKPFFSKEELIWSYQHGQREDHMARDFSKAGEAPIVGVCGHVHGLPQSKGEPRFFPHYIFADAGCGCHPKCPLVAIEVRSREVVYAHPTEAWVSLGS